MDITIPAFLLLTVVMEPCLFYRGSSLFWGQTKVVFSLDLYGITVNTGYSAHLRSPEWNMVQAMNISYGRNLEKFSVEIAHPNKDKACMLRDE